MENVAEYLTKRETRGKTDHELNGCLENFYHQQAINLGFPESYSRVNPDKLDRLALAYIENAYYKTGTGLFIQGDAYAGKTSHLAYLAYRIIKSAGFYGVADHPEMAEYWSSPVKDEIIYFDFMNLSSILSRPNDDKLVDFIKKATSVDYLFIDDIDRIEDGHALIRIENILTRRAGNNLMTVVTSTLTAESLNSNRIYSRIFRNISESCQLIALRPVVNQSELNLA